MTPAQLQILWDKYVSNTCTPEEEGALMIWLSDPANEDAAKQLLSGLYDSVNAENAIPAPVDYARILEAVRGESETRVRRIPNIYRRAVAAAAIMLIALTTWLLLKTPMVPQGQTAALDSTHILPATGVTMLTLPDGTQVPMDSLHNGTVAQQNGASLVLYNGSLRFEDGANNQPSVGFNTILTPKGQQFQISLPDGSNIWLNAGSSIRFPTAFAGNERRVTVSGEVYMEVRQDAHHPFVVELKNGDEISVLGTKFNINAYDNESHVYTTLLEGSVRVKAGNDQHVLRPGQQSRSGGDGLKVINVDSDKAVIWKAGAFDFEDVTLAEAMRQIERWYEITVVIEDGVPVDAPFYGQVSRKMSLNNLIKLFEKTDLKFRIENGKKLIVSK